jgi:hypothetical protein
MYVEEVGRSRDSDQLLAWCVWFEGMRRHRDVFPLAALEPASGRTPS